MLTTPQLENKCQLLQKEIDAIVNEYGNIEFDDIDISRELARLRNRAGEYRHGTFIALVVGPAKSGKSTLVNLIASAYVSPTNFLECTVRPSIISRQKINEESSLTCYTAKTGVDKVKHFDAIIDCVRGLDSESNLTGIEVEKLELNEKNIKERVELGLESSLSSDTLATSIRTPGGELLQEQVFLIDMPGFDGAYMNIDDPLYDAIAQRADLIIFVQSSNSAFSKVSKEFLNILGTRNKDVPVCIIHNVFDASWWKDKEEKDRMIREQQEFAYKEIRKQGFNVDTDHCHAINLGAVQDFRKGGFEGNVLMKNNDEEYRRIEQELFKRIINHKDNIRLTNSISRTEQQINNLLKLVKSVVERRENLTHHYDDVLATLDSIDTKLESSAEASLNIEAIKQIFFLFSHQAFGDYSNDRISYNNKDARIKISAFIDRVNDGYNESLADLLGVPDLETKLYNDFNTKITEIRNELSTITTSISKERICDRECVSYGEPLDIKRFLDINTIVPNRGNFITNMFRASHSAEDMRSYIEDIRNRLITTPDYKGQDKDFGYLLKDMFPAKIKEVNISINNAKNSYQSYIDKYMETSIDRILSEIIEHYDRYNDITRSLKSLQSNLENLIGHEKK